MELHGHFQNGVVVLDGGKPLPDGTRVMISPDDEMKSLFHFHPGPRTDVKLPLVESANPGTMWNTPEEIDEMAYGDELSS